MLDGGLYIVPRHDARCSISTMSRNRATFIAGSMGQLDQDCRSGVNGVRRIGFLVNEGWECRLWQEHGGRCFAGRGGSAVMNFGVGD